MWLCGNYITLFIYKDLQDLITTFAYAVIMW